MTPMRIYQNPNAQKALCLLRKGKNRMKHSSAASKCGKPAISLALMVMGVLACQSISYAQRSESRRSEPDPRASLTPELAAQLSQSADRSVIVIMKSRVAGDSAASDQAPLMDELRQVKAGGIKPFRLVNAFAATVSEGELARLKAHAAVERVLPDVVIRRKLRASPLVSSRTATAASVSPVASPQAAAPVLHTLPGACSSSAQGLLDPEALPLTNTASDDLAALTARSLGFTGAGVKVAAMTDGVDVNNINFIRANGTSAFIDYRDFTGDGPTAPTFGDEAFVDYNAVAGQGIHVYDVSQFSAQTDPAPCKIRIQGVAPGASLVGLKVLSANFTTISEMLQAIEYAVQTAHVDVLNESLGTNPNPDTSFLDALTLFDDAAVAAGVTVVVSSGDAGPTNTIGTPASDPNVISVGATTSFRFYAQTNLGAARYFATTGWLNDNISAFSSSGFTQTGRTVDLVAPGDFAWMSCDASANYSACVNFLNAPSNVEVSGGTSLSAPLTAGAAALVIEAYRGAHHGRSPSPALVKQILTSTATDLGVPANEQGAGLLNTYKAVLLAKSIDADTPAGQTLLLSQNQLNAVGLPGTNANWDVTVTNVSASPQTVTASGRTFGPKQSVQTGSVEINPPGAQFTYDNGLLYTYQTFTFQVPPGAARLYASIAYSESAVIARLSLIDPNGKFAAFSNPYGIGDAGNVDVRQPVPGAWTGVIFEYSALATPGTVLWQVYTQQFVPFASVSPGAFTLPPGASRTLEISAVTPAAPGDAAGSIVLTGSGGGTDPYLGPESNSIPVTLRSLVDANHGGSFSGTVIGGNGNFPPEGQVAYYQFKVGPGCESITATVSLSNDPKRTSVCI
jgi:Subtilase family